MSLTKKLASIALVTGLATGAVSGLAVGAAGAATTTSVVGGGDTVTPPPVEESLRCAYYSYMYKRTATTMDNMGVSNKWWIKGIEAGCWTWLD